jgi:hypothetical protein
MLVFIGMWIRTAVGSTTLRYTAAEGSQRSIRRIVLDGGRLYYRRTTSPNPLLAPPLGWALINERGQFPEELHSDDGMVGSRNEVIPSVPLWLPVLLFSLPPAYWYSYRTRFVKGHCAKCGYDMRATPERCPECGHAAESGGAGRA